MSIYLTDLYQALIMPKYSRALFPSCRYNIVLRDVDLSIKKGELAMVCGKVLIHIPHHDVVPKIPSDVDTGS
jgi:hypothetical protein